MGKTSRHHLPYWVLLASVAALMGLILLTSPQQMMDRLGLAGILLVFLLVYVVAFAVSLIVLRGGYALYGRATGKKLPVVAWRRAYYLSSIIAVIPVGVLLMQAQGGVGVWDIVLAVLFVSLMIVYVMKRT